MKNAATQPARPPLTARKATTCAVCHRGIRPGDLIQWHPGAPKGVPPYRRHEACGNGGDLVNLLTRSLHVPAEAHTVIPVVRRFDAAAVVARVLQRYRDGAAEGDIYRAAVAS